VIEGAEACDGADLGGETCMSQGFMFGQLGCAIDCTLDLSMCSDMPPGAWGDDFEHMGMMLPEWMYLDDAEWFATETMPHAGIYAGENADIGDDQLASMEVTLDWAMDGDVTFWYRVSTEEGWDYLRFYIDDVEQDAWSGLIDWTEISYPLAAGQHTLRWTYDKDGSLSENDDTVWIDDITTTNAMLP